MRQKKKHDQASEKKLISVDAVRKIPQFRPAIFMDGYLCCVEVKWIWSRSEMILIQRNERNTNRKTKRRLRILRSACALSMLIRRSQDRDRKLFYMCTVWITAALLFIEITQCKQIASFLAYSANGGRLRHIMKPKNTNFLTYFNFVCLARYSPLKLNYIWMCERRSLRALETRPKCQMGWGEEEKQREQKRWKKKHVGKTHSFEQQQQQRQFFIEYQR